jgi:transcription-repair coupling factor (superfamily II helicase)
VINQSNIYEYLKEQKNPNRLLICNDDKDAKAVGDVAKLLGYDVFVLPDIRVSYAQDLRSYSQEITQMLLVLAQYYKSKNPILVAPLKSTMLPIPKAQMFDSFTLSFGDEIDLNELKDKLYYWGYHFSDVTAQKAEVSFRGDIIDIYPINSDTPYRISLFDNEIESIHPFDEGSQKRIKDKECESIEIVPAFLALDKDSFQALEARCKNSHFDTFIKDIDSLGLWYLDDLGCEIFDLQDAILCSNLSEAIDEIYSLDTQAIPKERYNIPQIPPASNYKDIEVVDVNKIIEANKDKNINIIAKNESIIRGSQLIDIDRLNFIYQDIIVNIRNNSEFFISLNKPTKQRKVKKPSLVLDELNIGDYVVHENHGVGIFRGIQKREMLGAMREFVVIEYQNEDMLLIPVSNLEVIDRYVADSGTLPILDKMGKASFKKLKSKVKEKLFAIASQIINLSAQRHLKKGIILCSKEEQKCQDKQKARDIELEHKVFLSSAGFEHTPDQLKAIDDMLEDLASGKMMDRLLSADVGFGKTEVAMNGMFIAVKNGFQAMMIAPTTLLSSQHYKSLKERLGAFDISVAKVDRFTTTKEKNAILKGLSEGTIDVVVGTHALLKAKFANLALVVIDEEHKFGVKQKEALKEISVDVHLLSMSATPIPRSLNMALSQIKTFSEILTPPNQRVGVRTFVKNYDDKVIKEAILRELRRGGQVFYVFNSIAAIEDKKKILQKLLPKLRIAVLHSKVSAKETEDEMMKFEAGEYDVLLSTSIVESGIHMPQANTMIVDGADRFGIADLHQLRGRVGRGGKEGYCYFLVNDKEHLNDNAKRRLLALESHSDLGSGAVLAFHDLEIRGGGNIIGEAQSGHIKQIGYSLYLRMLEDAIRELSGKDKEAEHQVDMNLAIQAYINEDLVDEDRLRLELYRRLSQCETINEVYEIEAEIADRFGKLDTITRQFIDVMVLKVLAKEQKVTKVSSYGENVFIEFLDESKERVVLKSPSKDDDDIIATAMKYLKKS